MSTAVRAFVQARNYTKASRSAIDLVVIHDMEYPERPTGAEWCAGFFAGAAAPQASAHYCVDNDSIVQCVREEDVAWHAPGANAKGIGVEHAGYAKQTAAEWHDDYSTAMLELSAGLVADICHRYDIPVERPSVDALKSGARGIIGHIDATNAWSGGKGHTDPGPHFPWDWYLERVRANLALLQGIAGAWPDSDATEGWVPILLDGVRWLVSPVYLAPISIGGAEELVARMGCELPSPALVDAIWQSADLRIDAQRMAFTVAEGNDFTLATMASQETFARQAAKLEALVGDRALGVNYTLLAGAFKDVVKRDGVLGIYGYQRADGRVIQSFYAKHARGWIDYSQGVRPCRRATALEQDAIATERDLPNPPSSGEL